jgi:YVTN family beta-propeller protein
VRFFRVGFRAWNVALSRDERRLYTANGLSGDVSVIDLERNQVVATISTGGKPWDVVVGP